MYPKAVSFCSWGHIRGLSTLSSPCHLENILLSDIPSLSRVQLLATPWTATYQAPPSMGFSRQEYWVTFKIRVSCCKNHVWIGLQKQSFWLLGKELWKPEEPQCLVGKFWTASGKFSAVHRRGEAEALMGVCHSWQHHPFRLSLALF